MDVLLTAESERFTNDPRPHGRMFVRDTINVSMYLSYEFAMNLFHWEVEILRVIYDIKKLLMTSRYFGFYRPQCICGKVMFSQASVILFTGGGVSDRYPLGRHISGQTLPLGRHLPGRHLPGRHLPGRHPPTRQTPPQSDTAPGTQTPSADGYCCGLYTSYWNTFLFYIMLSIYE